MANYWLGHTLKRPRWRPQRQAVALGTLALFVGIIIGALYLAQAAAASTLGRQLEDLILTRSQLEQENERLRAEIASFRSVPRLLARAQELGFALADSTHIEYLTISGYNPNRQDIVPTREPDTRSVPMYDETFGGWLQQQIDNLTGQFQTFTDRGETP